MLTRLASALVACLVLAGCIAPAPSPSGWPTQDNPAAIHVHPFFTCTRQHEVGTADVSGYTRNTGNGYYSSYQFDLRTWQGAVSRAQDGIWAAWAAVTPDRAPVDVVDRAALQLADERGSQPWGGRCSEWLYR